MFYNSKPTALTDPKVLKNAKQCFFMPTPSKKAQKCQTMTYMPNTIFSCWQPCVGCHSVWWLSLCVFSHGLKLFNFATYNVPNFNEDKLKAINKSHTNHFGR